MASYQVPETSEKRMDDLLKFIGEFKENYAELKEKQKKAAGSRAKKVLNNIKKLGTAVRRDIQEEINNIKKR